MSYNKKKTMYKYPLHCRVQGNKLILFYYSIYAAADLCNGWVLYSILLLFTVTDLLTITHFFNF